MPPVSTVRVTFEGMLVMFLNDDREYCDVGFLKGIPHHYSEVQITKIPRVGAPEVIGYFHGAALKDQLILDVNKPAPRVRLYKSSAPDPFPRLATSDGRHDFVAARNRSAATR